MPTKEFIDGAMDAIGHDEFEAAIAQAKNLREKGEALFNTINK